MSPRHQVLVLQQPPPSSCDYSNVHEVDVLQIWVFRSLSLSNLVSVSHQIWVFPLVSMLMVFDDVVRNSCELETEKQNISEKNEYTKI